MTAKEMADNAKVATSLGGYYFSDKQFKWFCERLCREQRELCSDNLDTAALISDNPDYEAAWDSITNALKPEL